MKKFKVIRARAYHPTHNVAEIAFLFEGGERVFQMSAAEAATLANDLDPLKPARPALSDAEAAKAAGLASLPSVLPLPLVTGPITTVSMTDHPDGLAIEIAMETGIKTDTFQRVRIPMKADTARAIIVALRHRLEKIGQFDPLP